MPGVSENQRLFGLIIHKVSPKFKKCRGLEAELNLVNLCIELDAFVYAFDRIHAFFYPVNRHKHEKSGRGLCIVRIST